MHTKETVFWIAVHLCDRVEAGRYRVSVDEEEDDIYVRIEVNEDGRTISRLLPKCKSDVELEIEFMLRELDEGRILFDSEVMEVIPCGAS